MRQGTRVDDFRDEDPGRILHEMRYGEMTAFGERPHSPYYGNADATPLYVVLLDEYERWTGDTKLVRELEYEARAALNWIDEYANLRGDGYIWYQRRNEKTGLENQCWKDSWDSISTRDGTIPGFPRATCELQGYAYDAKMRAARLARTVWKDPAFAETLEKQAADLKRRFNRDFWVADDEYFALALDENGEQVDALASNNGHLLWSGIVDKSKAKAVVRHLMGPRLFSGWGVRTLASGQGRYNPIGYHVGTVWPFDNSFIAWGLRRYGFKEEAAQIASGILDAAAFFDGRLPEAFGGYPRHATKYPVQYPTACSPQAWSTGTPLLLLRTMLGLEPSGDHLIVDPHAARRHGSDRAARHPRPLGSRRRLRPRTLTRRDHWVHAFEVTAVENGDGCAADRCDADTMSPRCENACGKLPMHSLRRRGRTPPRSIPTSLCRLRRRSKSSRASSSRPMSARLSTNQNVVRRNVPSPAGSPSTPSSSDVG